MATILPPTPPSASAAGVNAVAGAQLQALGEVVVEQVPERIAQLARTILLSGTITGQQEGGALVLRTQVGELIIRSQTPLPSDRVLTLQIPPGAPPVRALVSVVQANALAPAIPAPVLATPAITPPISGAPQPAGPVLPASPGAVPGQPGVPVSVPVNPVAPVPGVVGSAPITAVNVPPVTSPATGPVTQPSGPAAPVASPVLVQAIAEIPLLPGTVLPAQVLAVPQLQFAPDVGVPVSVPLTLPPAVEAQARLQQSGATALGALVPQGLSDIIARLPPAVLLPVSVPDVPVVPGQPGLSEGVQAASQPGLARPVPPSVTVPALPPAFASLPVLLTLPPGSAVAVQVVSITPPPIPPSAVPAPPVPVGQQPAGEPVLATPPAATPASVSPVLPATASLAQPVSSSPALPVAPAPAPSFTAVIVGQTAQREPIATSPAGLFVLENRAPLPEGTQVELALISVTEPPAEAEPDIAIQRQPQDWPVLQQALAGAAAVQAASLAGPRLVRPDLAGSAILFILAALRIGQVQAIAGEDIVQTLRQKGQIDLLSRLSAEFQQMGQSWTRPDSAAGEWKTLLLPLVPQGQLLRLAIHTREERESHTHEGPVAYKRLVVELELSRLGPMLLDGYIRHKTMDLLLRSQRMLKKGLKDELRLAYRDTLSAMGWQGGLEFQTSAELWLRG